MHLERNSCDGTRCVLYVLVPLKIPSTYGAFSTMVCFHFVRHAARLTNRSQREAEC